MLTLLTELLESNGVDERMSALEQEPGEVISIEGTLLMLDDRTPHVAVPVQAIREGKVIATTLSDNSGRYRLVNLEAGSYQVRLTFREKTLIIFNLDSVREKR